MTQSIYGYFSSVSSAFWQAAADADQRIQTQAAARTQQFLAGTSPTPAYSPSILDSTLAFWHTDRLRAATITALALLAIGCTVASLLTLAGVITFAAGSTIPAILMAGAWAACFGVAVLAWRDEASLFIPNQHQQSHLNYPIIEEQPPALANETPTDFTFTISPVNAALASWCPCLCSYPDHASHDPSS